MLFWLLWFCNIVWNQGVWYLQLCSFHSGLFWLFWGLSWLHINLRIFCLISVEKCFWDFSKDCIESIACIGNMDILTVLTLSVHEQAVSFHLFVPSSVSFQCVLQFSVYRFFTSLVKPIYKYRILFVFIVNWIVFLISFSASSLLAYRNTTDFLKNCIQLLLAVLGLHCCMGFSLWVSLVVELRL